MAAPVMGRGHHFACVHRLQSVRLLHGQGIGGREVGHVGPGLVSGPGGALTLAGCWIHARRGLKEIFDSNGSPIAKAGLKRIAQLYKIEDKIRGEAPATRQFVRWTATWRRFLPTTPWNDARQYVKRR